MALDLNSSAALRLKEVATQAIREAKVVGNAFISLSSLSGLWGVDRVIPERGLLADQLRSYIGEHAFYSFATNELSDSFPRNAWQEVDERLLTDFDGYSDPSAIASDLVSSFSSLPWAYTLAMRLPKKLQGLLDSGQSEIAFSPRHCISFGSRLRETHAPLLAWAGNGLAALLGRENLGDWKSEEPYLLIRCQGYIQRADTETFHSAKDEIFAFLGLGIALELLDATPQLGNIILPRRREEERRLHIHRQMDGSWKYVVSADLEESHALIIDALNLNTTDRDGATIHTREILSRIGVVLNSKHGKRLALAARWLFDSYCGRDSLQQFIQAAVSIEILLGDEDAPGDVGLTTLMANRCAFLIGKTPTQRNNLLQLFRDIYKIRSKIVHTGKSRLSLREKGLFSALQELSASVIRNEVLSVIRAEGLNASFL